MTATPSESEGSRQRKNRRPQRERRACFKKSKGLNCAEPLCALAPPIVKTKTPFEGGRRSFARNPSLNKGATDAHASSGQRGVRGGLRPVTPAHRRAEDYARQWSGLPDGATKSSLLRLLEDVPARAMGLKPRERAFLHHLVKLQPVECFKPSAALAGLDLTAAGLALISTYADAYLMADLDVTCRTLARWREKTSRLGLDQLPGQSGSHPLPDRRGGRARRGLRGRSPSAGRPIPRTGGPPRPGPRRSPRAAHPATHPQLPFNTHSQPACRPPRQRGNTTSPRLLCAPSRRFAAARISIWLGWPSPRPTQPWGRLEALLDHQVWGSSGVTEESGAPDRNGAQLLPTQLEKIQIRESSLGRGGSPRGVRGLDRAQAGRNRRPGRRRRGVCGSHPPLMTTTLPRMTRIASPSSKSRLPRRSGADPG